MISPNFMEPYNWKIAIIMYVVLVFRIHIRAKKNPIKYKDANGIKLIYALIEVVFPMVGLCILSLFIMFFLGEIEYRTEHKDEIQAEKQAEDEYWADIYVSGHLLEKYEVVEISEDGQLYKMKDRKNQTIIVALNGVVYKTDDNVDHSSEMSEYLLNLDYSSVYLETDTVRDSGGYVLGYIWLNVPDEDTINELEYIENNMLNAMLIKKGYAKYGLRIMKNNKYEEFLKNL